MLFVSIYMKERGMMMMMMMLIFFFKQKTAYEITR